MSLISFTIAGTTYQAEEGMTWAEWCNSAYNTGGYLVNNKYIKKDTFNYIAYGMNMTTRVLNTDTITANFAYQLISDL